MKCIGNRNFAKRLRLVGSPRNYSLDVASDPSTVIVLLHREDGTRLRLNFARPEARRLADAIRNACDCANYGTPETMRGEEHP